MAERFPESEDVRSKRFVFVPFCSLAQGVRATGIVRHFPAVVKPVLDFLADHDINIVQMPCPELLFDSFRRKPCGKAKYDNPHNRKVCRHVAEQVVAQVKLLQQNACNVEAIVGVEFSPSCAVSIVAVPPPERRATAEGIYTEELKAVLREQGIDLPFVGIEIYHLNRTLQKLKQTLHVNGMSKTTESRSRIDVKKYKAWLQSGDPHHRITALTVLWHSGVADDDTYQIVTDLLRTDDVPGIRRDAIRMLRDRRDQKDKSVFMEVLEDNDYIVRGEAVLALKSLGQDSRDDPRFAHLMDIEVHPFVRACLENL